jgi:hypothetical protein
VLIGKIDGNQVRFLEFLENQDPVVTIIGMNPNILAESLEKNSKEF